MPVTVKIKVDQSAILRKMVASKAFVQKGWVVAERFARRRFEKAKGLYFREFLDHEVTKEVQRGPGTYNTSGLLGGVGNLYSFFGFDEGEDPIGSVELYLQSQFDFRRGSYRGKQWNFRVSFPDEERVENYVVGKFGADYTSESWIGGVEHGYSGLNYYLRFRGMGRSGGGIQVKNAVRELNFRTTKYFSGIVDNFRRNIKL